jgi:hypothetical protein
MKALELALALIRLQGQLLQDWKAAQHSLIIPCAAFAESFALSDYLIHDGTPSKAPAFDQLESEVKALGLVEDDEDLIWSYPPYRAVVESLPHLEVSLAWAQPEAEAEFIDALKKATVAFNQPLVDWGSNEDWREAKEHIERSCEHFKSRLNHLQGRGALRAL